MTATTTDTAPAPPPPAVQESNARQALRAAELLVLEHAAVRAVTAPLRRQLVAVQRAATRAWIAAFGSLDAPGDPIRAAAVAAQVRGELARISIDVSGPLAGYTQRALALGVEQAAKETGTSLTAADIGAAVDAPTSRLVAGLDQTVAAAIGDAESAVGQISGAGFAEVDRALANAHRAVPKAAATTVTAVHGGANAGKVSLADFLGADLLWLAEPDACVSCQGFAGRTTSASQPFDASLASTFTDKPRVWPPGPVVQPPLHPHCLPGDALVLPSGSITGATARVFDGELVEIRTLNQKVFTATPNHPVLTDRGWVPIGLVDQGSYVVGAVGGEWMALADNHDQNMPARIQDVAEAFLRSGNVSAVEVPVSAEDFHGDGSGSQVAVVGTNRQLGDSTDAPLCQKCRQVLFERTRVSGAEFVNSRRLDLLFKTAGAAADGGMGGLSPFGSLLGSGLGHAQIHAGASSTSFDAGLMKYPRNGSAADAVGFGNDLLAHSGLVELDQVVQVRRYPFVGHVYNLETTEGWYIGNGIVTHNCRCELVPWLGTEPGAVGPSLPEALQREAQRAILKGWSLPSESGAERVRAARKLLARNPAAPKSVKAYARRAVAAGHFPTRDVPHYTPRPRAAKTTPRTKGRSKKGTQ